MSVLDRIVRFLFAPPESLNNRDRELTYQTLKLGPGWSRLIPLNLPPLPWADKAGICLTKNSFVPKEWQQEITKSFVHVVRPSIKPWACKCRVGWLEYSYHDMAWRCDKCSYTGDGGAL